MYTVYPLAWVHDIGVLNDEAISDDIPEYPALDPTPVY
jgi:hypothetical protein